MKVTCFHFIVEIKTLFTFSLLKEALRNRGNKILTNETFLPWPVGKGQNFENLFSFPLFKKNNIVLL